MPISLTQKFAGNCPTWPSCRDDCGDDDDNDGDDDDDDDCPTWPFCREY